MAITTNPYRWWDHPERIATLLPSPRLIREEPVEKWEPFCGLQCQHDEKVWEWASEKRYRDEHDARCAGR